MVTLAMVLRVAGLQDRPITPEEWRKFITTYMILTDQTFVPCVKDPVLTIFTPKSWGCYEISNYMKLKIVTSECPEGFDYSSTSHPVVRFFQKEVDGVLSFIAKKTVCIHNQGQLLMPDGYAVKSTKIEQWLANAYNFGYNSEDGVIEMKKVLREMSDEDATWVTSFFRQLNLPWKATFTPMENRRCFIVDEQFLSLIDYCIPNWAQPDKTTGLYPRPHLAVGDAIIFSDEECYNIGVEEFKLTHTVKVA